MARPTTETTAGSGVQEMDAARLDAYDIGMNEPYHTERQFAERLKAAGAAEVWLFGSHATGEANEGSDVDFMVVFDDAIDAVTADRNVERIVTEIERDYDVEIDAITIRSKAFHWPIDDLHPASVTYACRSQGMRLA